jgi:hypothetical protein
VQQKSRLNIQSDSRVGTTSSARQQIYPPGLCFHSLIVRQQMRLTQAAGKTKPAAYRTLQAFSRGLTQSTRD